MLRFLDSWGFLGSFRFLGFLGFKNCEKYETIMKIRHRAHGHVGVSLQNPVSHSGIVRILTITK